MKNKLQSFTKQLEQYKADLQEHSFALEVYGSETNRIVQSYNSNINKYSQILQSKIALIKMLKDEFAESIK